MPKPILKFDAKDVIVVNSGDSVTVQLMINPNDVKKRKVKVSLIINGFPSAYLINGNEKVRTVTKDFNALEMNRPRLYNFTFEPGYDIADDTIFTTISANATNGEGKISSADHRDINIKGK